jgi:extracellular elastinolytic metalloproteinase
MIQLLILFLFNYTKVFGAPVLQPKSNSSCDPVLPVFYYPESISGIPATPIGFDKMSDFELAIATLSQEIGASEKGKYAIIYNSLDVILDHEYKDCTNAHHFFFSRIINSIKVSNQNAVVHIDSISQSVLYYTSSFSLVNPLARRNTILNSDIIVCESEAIKMAEELLGIKKNNIVPTLSYIEFPTGLIYAHNFQLQDDTQSLWLQVTVDTQTGKMVQVVDYTSHASYQAIILPSATPLDGFRTVTNPADSLASPFGWNSDGAKTFLDVQGNNVQVLVGQTLAKGDVFLNFKSQWNKALKPSDTINQAASSISIFYLLNTVHDILYHFGFNEEGI